MATRSKNATTHPGAILQDIQRVRRSKAEIAEEKELKNALVKAKQQQQKANQVRRPAEKHISNGLSKLKPLRLQMQRRNFHVTEVCNNLMNVQVLCQ
jgi:hypothetical protein